MLLVLGLGCMNGPGEGVCVWGGGGGMSPDRNLALEDLANH